MQTIVTADNGTEFTVLRSVRLPKYETRETIAFFDRQHLGKFPPHGQFVSEYHLDIIERCVENGTGLNLHGGIPAWQIDAATLRQAWDTLKGDDA